MRYAITFIVAVIFCFLVDIHAAYAYDGWEVQLQPQTIDFDLDGNAGIMVAIYDAGELAQFENQWLHAAIIDPATGTGVDFDLWLTVWIGVCASPCYVTVEFITKNVNWITK